MTSPPRTIPAKLNYVDETINNAGANLPYAGLLSSTLGHLRTTVERTTKGFTSTDPRAGVGGLLEIVGTTVPLLSLLAKTTPFGATFFSVFGAMFGIAGGVMGEYFVPQTKSLSDQISQELNKFRAGEHKEELADAKEAFERADEFTRILPDQGKTWAQFQTEVPMNLLEGNAMSELGTAKEWLATNSEDVELLSEWNNVFDVYWYAVARRTLFVTTMVSKLRVDDGDLDKGIASSAELGSRMLKMILTADAEFAHQIHRAALNNGTLWHVGDNRRIYTRTGVIRSKDKWSFVSLNADDLAVVGAENTIFKADLVQSQVYGNKIKILGDSEDAHWTSFCVAPDERSAWTRIFGVGQKGKVIACAKVPDTPPEVARAWSKCRVSDGRVIDMQAWVFSADGLLLTYILGGRGLFPTPRLFIDRYLLSEDLPGTLELGKSYFSCAVPEGLRAKSIAVNDFIYVASGSEIYRMKNSAFSELNWSKVEFKNRGKHPIKYISASGDGQLLAICGTKIWALFENVQPETETARSADKITEWVEVSDADAVAVCKVPTRGYKMFKGYLECCRAAEDTVPVE